MAERLRDTGYPQEQEDSLNSPVETEEQGRVGATLDALRKTDTYKRLAARGLEFSHTPEGKIVITAVAGAIAAGTVFWGVRHMRKGNLPTSLPKPEGEKKE